MDAVVDPGGLKEESVSCANDLTTVAENSNVEAEIEKSKNINDYNEDDFNSSTGELEVTINNADDLKVSCRKQSSAPQIDMNQLHSEPDFAAVCSFFNKFNVLIGIKSITFTKLENILTSFDIEGRGMYIIHPNWIAPFLYFVVNKELIDLHLTLMRRVRMSSVRTETWENYLMKFLATNDMLQGELFQLERYGYVHLPVSSKIQILKALCEAQFDFNPKLKENIVATCKAFDLRLIPLGMDKSGLSYWFQQDIEHNIRFYTEEQDDQSGVTWTLVARSAEELEKLIVKLKAEDLGYKRKDSDGKGEEKAVQTDMQEGSMVMSTKKGTFIDICYDEVMIKKMREAIIKQKEERKNKRERKGEIEKEEGCGEEDEEKPGEVDDDMEDWSESTSASDSESGEEGDSFDSNDGDDLGAGSSDDEFMPKSVRKSLGKRRRRDVKKKKKKLDLDDMDEEDEDSDEEEEQKERKKATEETSCGQCKTSSDWDVLLLCDVCDDAWHTYCLKPMLWYVPDGDWFCPKCVHGMLIEKLEEVAMCLDFHLKKKSAEDKRKKAAADRLRREMEYIGVSLNNIIPTTLKQSALPSSSSSTESEDDGQRRCKKKAVKRIAPKSKFQREVMMTIAEGRSRRKTKQVDYNFSEYDSVIQEACEEMGDVSSNEREGGDYHYYGML
uniref:PHD-type domain-containing protein n=1 Tax=Heterorhabditis bacteriophora TaxID=37862 RepID=A0A1I7XVS0_HETBA